MKAERVINPSKKQEGYGLKVLLQSDKVQRLTLRRKWLKIAKAALTPIKQQHFTISRHASPCDGFLFHATLRLIELASVLVRFGHVASFIVNANYDIV